MAHLQRYKTSDPFRGLMVIINNVNFEKAGGGSDTRDGSDKDVDSLKETFGQLGFEFQIHNDRTCGQMLTDMSEVAHSKHLAKYDCLAVVILTHGKDENTINGVGGDHCTIDSVLQPLKDIKKEMPKLVFVQACRGEKDDEGHDVQADGGVSSRGERDCIRLPIESDFFYHYSSSPGFFSFRDEVKGSVFIQALCTVYNEYMAGGVEFNVLIPHVEINRRVAENFEWNESTKGSRRRRQMPSFVSMLRKHLFLKRRT